jgi:hypothetical protein
MVSKVAGVIWMAVMGLTFALNVAFAADPAAVPIQVAPPVETVTVPKVAPLADKLLAQTCQILGLADAFNFHAEVLFDQVLPSAVKVQFAGAMDFALQRPDELVMDYHSDLGGKQLWYQNDTLTIFEPAASYVCEHQGA